MIMNEQSSTMSHTTQFRSF